MPGKNMSGKPMPAKSMFSTCLAILLAGGVAAFGPAAADEARPASTPLAAAALAQVPEPLDLNFARPPAAHSAPAVHSAVVAARPAASANDRKDALLRALFLITSGGTARPFPLMPLD